MIGMLVKESIPFQSTIGASTSKTLVSKAITRKFYTWKIIMHFPDAADYLLLYRWFISKDSESAGTGVPSGKPLFVDESDNDSWRGDNMTIEVAHIKEITDVPCTIKLYTTNGVASGLPISCFLEILREV
mgnify:CR=1 FL=1